MSTLKVRQIDQSLCKKGFIKAETDHTYYYFTINGKNTGVWTKVSHGEKEIGNPLIKQMARQTKLDSNQFLDLINCPLSQDEYLEILGAKGVL